MRRLLRHWLIEHLFARFRWYRRWRGGHWEQRWIGPPVASTVWMQNRHDNPVWFSMLDACEDHPTKKVGHES